MSVALGTVLVGERPDHGSLRGLEAFGAALAHQQRALQAARHEVTALLPTLQSMHSTAVTKILLILDRIGIDSTEVLADWCAANLRVVRRYCVEREALARHVIDIRRGVSAGLATQQQLRRRFDAITESESGGCIPSPGSWRDRIAMPGLADEAVLPSKRWNATVENLRRYRSRYEHLQDDRKRIDRQLAQRITHVPSLMVSVSATGALAVLALDTISPSAGVARIDRLAQALALIQQAGAAAEIAEYWSDFDAQTRMLLADRHPILIGALDGADVHTRSRANLNTLQMWLNDPATSQAVRNDLERIRDVIATEGAHSRTLLTLDLIDDHRIPNGSATVTMQRVAAVIGVGDIDRADRLVWTVFGMNTDAGSAQGGVRAVENIVTSATKLDASTTFGGIAWLGYDSPTALEEPFKVNAERGGERLAQDLDRFIAGRAEPVKISLLGHSYGSFTSVEGLRRMQHRDSVHTYIALGSPGVPRDTARVLGSTPAYAANARGDRVADLGQYISNSARFAPVSAADQLLPWGPWDGQERPWVVQGIHEISAEESGDGVATTSHSLVTSDNVGYLSRGSTSLDRVARVVARE